MNKVFVLPSRMRCDSEAADPQGVPVPDLLISGGLQLDPAVISSFYKRIPVVTLSYCKLKECWRSLKSRRTVCSCVVQDSEKKKKNHPNSMWII